MAHEVVHDGPPFAAERRLPPVAELAVGSMALVIIGGIYLAAHIPGRTPLAPAVVLLIGAAILLAAVVVALGRVGEFAWHRFRQVLGWTVLAYIAIAGMIELTFILDGTPSRIMVILTLMLVIFAVDIPLLFAFSVARYQPASSEGGELP